MKVKLNKESLKAIGEYISGCFYYVEKRKGDEYSMMKSQIETLYRLKEKIEYEREKANPRSYEWAELDKELAALSCAIFELENR